SKYLKDLRERYHGDWYLAWAGYNAGEGKVDKAIRRESTRDFWRMMTKGRTLRAETKHYVPKLIAAALIAKHPERFGFHVEYEEPFDSDEVVIPDATDLKVIADAAGITIEKVRELNPELRRFCTPPGEFTMRLPKGSKDQFAANFEKVGPEERLRFTQHKVEKGEPLAKIARAYGVSEAAIMRTNGLKSYRQVKVGKVIVIPVGKASRGLLAGAQLEDRRGRGYAQARTPVQKSVAAATAAAVRAKDAERMSIKHAVYVVKPGDTLWGIAAKFSTTVARIKRLNGMSGRRGRGLELKQRYRGQIGLRVRLVLLRDLRAEHRVERQLAMPDEVHRQRDVAVRERHHDVLAPQPREAFGRIGPGIEPMPGEIEPAQIRFAQPFDPETFRRGEQVFVMKHIEVHPRTGALADGLHRG